MTQDNIEQQKNTPVKWIVPLPEKEGGTFGRPSLCAACRGNEDIGVVLNYFVFEASREAKNKKIDLEKAEYIRLKRGLDEILDGIKPSRTSKTTLIGYHHKLHEWGLVLSDGYKQQYDVYFHKITEAIQNPPPEEKRKPRGRHVARLQASTDSSSEDFSFNNDSKLESSTVKTEIQEDSNFNQISVLTSQISKLEFEILNLKSEISALTSQMLNLKSSESSKAASQQVGDTQNDALRLLRDCNRLLKTIKSNMVAVPRNMFSLLTEEDYRTIDELMTVASVASATPSPLIENLYQSQSLSEKYPPEPPQGGVTSTPAGNSTAADGGNSPAQEPTFPQSSALSENPEPSFLDTAIPEPPSSTTDGLVQESPAMPRSETTPSESPRSAKESTSSTQAVNGTSNQATEQEKQPGSNSYSPKKATNDQPTQATLTPVPEVPKQSRRDPMNDRVKNFYDAFRLLGIEFFDDQTFKFDMTYNKKDSMHKTIVGLINDGTTPKEMRQVFQYMWDKQDKNSGEYYWRDPDHLTIRAFVRNYRTHLASVKFRTKQAENEAAKKREQGKKVAVGAGIITTGPLAGQPDYDADPWS